MYYAHLLLRNTSAHILVELTSNLPNTVVPCDNTDSSERYARECARVRVCLL